MRRFPVSRKQPPESWFKLAEVARFHGVHRNTMQDRLRRLAQINPEAVNRRVVIYKNALWVHPEVMDLLEQRYPIRVLKQPPRGWKKTAAIAREYGIPQTTITTWAREGKVRAVRVGKSYYLHPGDARDEAERYLESNRRPGRGWITTRAAQMVYDVHHKTLRRLAELGEVRTLAYGDTRYYWEEDVARYRRENDRGAKPPPGMVSIMDVAERLGVRPRAVFGVARRHNLPRGLYWDERRGRWITHVDRRVERLVARPMPPGWVALRELVSTPAEVKRLKRRLVREGVPVEHYKDATGRPVLAAPREEAIRCARVVLGHEADTGAERRLCAAD